MNQSGGPYKYDDQESLKEFLNNHSIEDRHPVLVVVGWAKAAVDDEQTDRVFLLLRDKVIPTCQEFGATIISGGTSAGVMSLLGKAAKARNFEGQLIGVAPYDLLRDPVGDTDDACAPEPNHLIVGAPGTMWGAERDTLIAVAEHIAGDKPIAMIAIGGNDGTRREVEMAARRRWPVMLLTDVYSMDQDTIGSPPSQPEKKLGASFALSNQLQFFYFNRQRTWINSAPLLEPWRRLRFERIVKRGALSSEIVDGALQRRFASTSLLQPDRVSQMLTWMYSTEDLLKSAWVRFSVADLAARWRKGPTNRFALFAALAATATILAIALYSWKNIESLSGGAGAKFEDSTYGIALRFCILGLPLLAVFSLNVMGRRSRTGSWIELRNAAESTIAEIYRFRACAAPYVKPLPWRKNGNREIFVKELEALDLSASGAYIYASSRPTTSWPAECILERAHASDLLLNKLTVYSYAHSRVDGQIAHYERRPGDEERTATQISAAAFLLTAAATIFLSISWRDGWGKFAGWASVAASVAAALVAWREFRHRDNQVDTMLATGVALRARRAEALSRHDSGHRGQPLSDFVETVEGALATERVEWLRTSRNAQQIYLSRQFNK